jgi:alpha-glucoside transport system substrate-binding protein
LSKCPGLEEQVRAQYPQSFLDLATVNGVLYGFFMKADSKATIWYNPSFFQQKGLQPLAANATFNDLVALSNKVKDAGLPPWSIGQEAGAGSGYPGSDVIQQILLNDAGAQTYDAIVNGTMPFNSPAMKDAWTKFGQMVNTPGFVSQGNAAGVNATNFQDATYPPFQSPPKAGMVPLGGFTAGFIAKQFPSLKAGKDYDFFPWPGGGVTGGANIAYAFNSNPATCSFLSYIASPEAQTVWVKRGGFTSVNTKVDQSAYPDDVSKKLAQQLTTAKAFRFDLDDAIGGAAQQAEFKGVTQFLQNPGTLDQILAGIQAAMPTPKR